MVFKIGNCLGAFAHLSFTQMATLAVQEAMGFKVDREAVATLVLPQLWSMSIGPREWAFEQYRFAD